MSTTERDAIAIRRMVQGDIDAVQAFVNGLITHEDINAIDIGGAFDFSFVAEDEGHIAGFILAKQEYLGIPLVRLCLVRGVVVGYNYQRQGVGEKLVQHLLSYSKSKGIKVIRTLIDNNDPKSLYFTESMGFKCSSIVAYDKTLKD